MGPREERLNLAVSEMDQSRRLQIRDRQLPHLRKEGDAGQQKADRQQVDIFRHSDRDLHVFFHHTSVKEVN